MKIKKIQHCFFRLMTAGLVAFVTWFAVLRAEAQTPILQTSPMNATVFCCKPVAFDCVANANTITYRVEGKQVDADSDLERQGFLLGPILKIGSDPDIRSRSLFVTTYNKNNIGKAIQCRAVRFSPEGLGLGVSDDAYLDVQKPAMSAVGSLSFNQATSKLSWQVPRLSPAPENANPDYTYNIAISSTENGQQFLLYDTTTNNITSIDLSPVFPNIDLSSVLSSRDICSRHPVQVSVTPQALLRPVELDINKGLTTTVMPSDDTLIDVQGSAADCC